jgi:hypothetical protein
MQQTLRSQPTAVSVICVENTKPTESRKREVNAVFWINKVTLYQPTIRRMDLNQTGFAPDAIITLLVIIELKDRVTGATVPPGEKVSCI